MDPESHPLAVWAQTSELNRLVIKEPDNLNSVINFMIAHEWHDSTSIDVRDVTGSIHPEYVNLTWAELLIAGKRMHINLPLLDSNPDYYLDQYQRKNPAQYFINVDGSIYVGADGNQRTAIAKAYFMKEHICLPLCGVTLDSYTIDISLMEAFNRLVEVSHRYRFSVDHIRRHVSRMDAPGKMLDRFSHEIYVIRGGRRISVNYNQILEILDESSSIFKKFTGKYKFLW